jgi:trehalose/maltose hydrolase-like predicted phosphorylase
MYNNVLWLNPILPEEQTRLSMNVRYGGHSLVIEITADKLVVTCLRHAAAGPIQIGFKGDIYLLGKGETQEFTL